MRSNKASSAENGCRHAGGIKFGIQNLANEGLELKPGEADLAGFGIRDSGFGIGNLANEGLEAD